MTELLPIPTQNSRFTVLTPNRQASFLENLAQFGNVRLACRAATISPQTAYRARRASPGFARAWDACLVNARTRAEEVLADRALNGIEEQVFYHGEEVATRRRYSDRLLLAHLARLDRLETREDVAATLPLLDAQIEALRRGEELPEALPEYLADGAAENEPLDCVPGVPSCGTYPAPIQRDDPSDPMWLGNRLDRMDDARPAGAKEPHQMARDCNESGEIEAVQLEAFEAGLDEWWLVKSEEELEAARLAQSRSSSSTLP